MMNQENKIIYNSARQAWLLYLQGLRLQMEYEKMEPTEDTLKTLEDIRDYNNKLYDYISQNE